MTIKRRRHRFVSSVKLWWSMWMWSKVVFNVLLFLNYVLNASVSLLTHVNTTDGIYKFQNISERITVLTKTPLLTLKLMMCRVASYQIYAKSIHGIDLCVTKAVTLNMFRSTKNRLKFFYFCFKNLAWKNNIKIRQGNYHYIF